MSEHLDIDPMLFLDAVVEQQLEVLAAVKSDLFGIAGLGDGVAEIAQRELDRAQTALDNLIAEDDTWRPA